MEDLPQGFAPFSLYNVAKNEAMKCWNRRNIRFIEK